MYSSSGRPCDRYLVVDLFALLMGEEDYAEVEYGAFFGDPAGFERRYLLKPGAALESVLAEIEARRFELTAGLWYQYEECGRRAVWDLAVPGAEEARDFWNCELPARLEALDRVA